MKRLGVFSSLLAAAALALPAGASADNEYAFTCQYSGDVSFEPGLTFAVFGIQEGKVEGSGTGTCTGAFRGEPFSGPFTWTSKGRYSGSCEAATGRVHNQNRVLLPDGRELIANGHGTFTSAGVVITFQGKSEGNGTYTGQATSLPVPPPANQACTPQDPLVHTRQTGQFQTVDPPN